MNGESGVMIGFIRDETEDGSYKIHVERIPIEQVMLYERVIPESYVNERKNDVTEEFARWCRPLIGPELRDFIDFNDYTNQQEWAAISQSINSIVDEEVVQAADPAGLNGKTVTFEGAFTVSGNESILITPVRLETN